ncbi:hypothetical protein B0J17DRAFT_187929 [Rhizoctonia solani]|nr:hypothetical protein B0J17DRAFT_187929 [Rhizoctonia solani]
MTDWVLCLGVHVSSLELGLFLQFLASTAYSPDSVLPSLTGCIWNNSILALPGSDFVSLAPNIKNEITPIGAILVVSRFVCTTLSSLARTANPTQSIAHCSLNSLTSKLSWQA